jgi:hypothetical protein
MIKLGVLIATVAVLASAAATAALAQDYGSRTVRFGNTGGWAYDGRDDDRDFRDNGVFPGNFASAPLHSAIGAAGLFGSTPSRSVKPYPSQVVFEPARDRDICVRRNRCLRSGIRHIR